MNIKHHRPYEVARKKAYPDVKDQLDAIWKFIEAAKGKVELPDEVEAMATKIRYVKVRFPKDGIKKVIPSSSTT